MLTKAIIQSIDYTKNMCRVRIPLFENASRNTNMIEADAQFNIVPGIYNGYKTGDIVFIGFEENKMELPVILGKLFISSSTEASSARGNLSGNSLVITDTAQLPYYTIFDCKEISQNNKLYKNLNTPKKLADSIIELQQSQANTYQTVIKVLATPVNREVVSAKVGFDLYLKTTTDFTYKSNNFDEGLNRFCTAMQKSLTDKVFTPLDLAIAEDNSVHQALIKPVVEEDTNSPNTSFMVLIDGTSYTFSKLDILEISSLTIYY